MNRLTEYEVEAFEDAYKLLKSIGEIENIDQNDSLESAIIFLERFCGALPQLEKRLGL